MDAPCQLESVHGAPSRTVTYCDWRLTVDPIKRRVTTEVYDKRQDMPIFSGCRTFPHGASMIHEPAKLNVITSQFIRFARRSSSMSLLVTACAELMFRMLRHGYADRKVRHMAYRFRRHWHSSGANRLGRWTTFHSRLLRELTRLFRRR